MFPGGNGTRHFLRWEGDEPIWNLPDAVEDIPVPGDPQQLVVCGDLVEVGPLLVSKEQVRFPDGIQHGRVQVQRVIRVFVVGQPGVIPLLPQEDVDPIVLRPGDKEVEPRLGPGMSPLGGPRCFQPVLLKILLEDVIKVRTFSNCPIKYIQL